MRYNTNQEIEYRILDGGYSQIEARIIDSLDRMTPAFANSQILNTEMMLVGTIEDPAYVAPGSSSANLGDELINLRNENDGVLDTVTNLSNRLAADLVSFVTPAGQGGQAGVAKGGNRYTINSRASMTASQMVMAHEMGHNMGCGHAWGDSSKSTSANTGWRFKTPGGSQLTTIMAYTDGGVTSINWSAAKSQSWVTLSPASDTLAPAASTTVTVSINSNANVLSPGAYTDTVAFLNTTNENGNTSRAVSLVVNPSPASFYWDSNVATAGTPTGTWRTSNFWNTNSTGGAGTFSSTTANTADLFFVAGPASNSGNGNATITVSGAQVANSITSQHSGSFTLSGGTSITLGNATAGQGGINVGEFAFGTTVQGKLTISTPVILNNSQTWTNNKVDTSALQQTAGLELNASSANSLTLNHPLIIDGKGVTSLSAATTTTLTGTGSITIHGRIDIVCDYQFDIG
jgi:Metallo-peptidase family M12B Reprolysin-like/Viral BACON domain